MPTLLRRLRRRILTPDVSQTRLSTRGFHEKDHASRHLLETVGETFLYGYARIAEAATPADAVTALENVPARFRGFAYEGATMACAVLDGLPFGRTDNVRRFLAGPGDPHVYMAYVGVGWAMARLPRLRWSALYAPDPVLRWLVLDGYGFHQAYFRTRDYVHGQRRDTVVPWRPDAENAYAGNAFDQGIGRALWFVCGTDADRVATTVEGFAPQRRADLYSGVGLAATYAGGADAGELTRLLHRAGEHRAAVSQGSAFAASARVRAGLENTHTDLATGVLCAMTAKEAAEQCDRTRPAAGDVPGVAYETWRSRLRDVFAVVS
ncbi:uncharacterized protein DUF1702 [Actinoplanes teichomyceticus]|uniref:Uncharacterized protein DUF1702 n=1 Tax=Actinoplanes teichomyceticus TaxID=1867 RepID=A0A561WBW7_ACTTI|nr:DUF1702 family protein [Actinoplanes teichomyceticus]TWG21333.1 uncharacterized protein DUF1702 [Actinoplanes teichomyceticus]GIF16418.1 enediyne biosynthesis protein [Actinoplanes teichomyceticus]